MRLAKRILQSPDVLLKGVSDPTLVALILNKIYHQSRKGTEYNHEGTDVFANEDWDNLIILDACRYDVYADMTPFEGPVERRTSRGTSSDQFVYGNFHGKTLHNVAYVSGNRWYPHLRESGKLSAEVHAYHDIERDAFDGYVPSPEKATEAALEMAGRHPRKRLVVHYMQPHKPYFGEYRDVFTYDTEEDYGLRGVMRTFDVDPELLLPAYRENLAVAFDHVQRLVDELDGKTVITSDHGEMLGDRLSPIPVRWYGHPSRVYIDELATVPWQVVSDGPRRTITSDPPESKGADYDAEELEETLRNLGYKV